jgi:predicted transcriptional regulator
MELNMTKRKPISKDKLLTEVELELMTILWGLSEGSCHDVLEQLPKGRELAYTSVSTILRILEQKNFLGSRKEGRGHIYFPLLSKVEYESTTVRHMVNKVFDGAPVALVKRLLDSENLSKDDIDSIQHLLKERSK